MMKIFGKVVALGISISMMGTITGSVGIVRADSQPANMYYCGDIDNNGNVDVTDSSLLNMFLSGDGFSAHDRMTERLDVNNNKIIDYKDVEAIRRYITHEEPIEATWYTNSSDLIEVPIGLYYTKVDLSNNTVSRSNYWLGRANVISESISSYQLLNEMEVLNTTSVSNEKGIVKLTATIGNETIVETGFVVDNNVILTAASNLCKKVNGTWKYASNITCDIYTLSGTLIHSGYSAKSYHIPYNYTSLSDNTKYNYAAIKLDNTVNLSAYKMKLGATTTAFNSNIKTTSISVNGVTSTRTHSLYGQKVNGEFINYTSGYGEVAGQYGAPIYVEYDNSQAIVLGIASTYYGGISPFNRSVRIDSDIFRFIYRNSSL